jgi:hypothetical protein
MNLCRASTWSWLKKDKKRKEKPVDTAVKVVSIRLICSQRCYMVLVDYYQIEEMIAELDLLQQDRRQTVYNAEGQAHLATTL